MQNDKAITHPMDQVAEFMRAFDQEIPDVPTRLDNGTHNLRCELIQEELDELSCAIHRTEYLDAVIDLLYVVYGAALAAGYDKSRVDGAFAEVHRSNMSKLWNADEVLRIKEKFHVDTVAGHPGLYIVKNAVGKVVKSPSYSPAQLEQFTH